MPDEPTDPVHRNTEPEEPKELTFYLYEAAILLLTGAVKARPPEQAALLAVADQCCRLLRWLESP
ncbi:hypothetical protein EDD29_5765 [Actinocorallia herbida]|uniref:Uncharacterized protein n=1 Tax=Actinocorallia herbida TaxID=58109 RepID=A0A3N1D3J2_9ACTN|nr:hypothetical protein [Actinocorallia herbida]ROO88107.1 hypothetical protein EDD29_5765 [Actinocorallia herbida]